MKLDHYGIRYHTRKQRVVHDGEASSEVHVDSGVPQNTVLDPLIFLINVNDMGEGVFSQTTAYIIEPLNLKATPNSYRKILAK